MGPIADHDQGQHAFRQFTVENNTTFPYRFLILLLLLFSIVIYFRKWLFCLVFLFAFLHTLYNRVLSGSSPHLSARLNPLSSIR